MKKTIDGMDNILQKIEGTVVFFSGIIIIAMLTLICLEVILRTAISISIPGIFEMASQMMVAISLLGISYVQRRREHITVDIISEKIPTWFDKLNKLFVYLIGIILGIIFAWQGWISFLSSWQTQEYTLGIVRIPLWPGKLSVAIAMTLITFRFLVDFFNEIMKTKNNNADQILNDVKENV